MIFARPLRPGNAAPEFPAKRGCGWRGADGPPAAFSREQISENVSDGEYALDLLMIAKYFEKIGDHAVNIAEWVEYSLTGVHKG